MNSRNEDLSSIMESVTAGLTGDRKKDCAYLMEQCEKYRDHELSQEILRACGRLLSQLLPEDVQNQVDQALDRSLQDIEAPLDRARKLTVQKQYKEALDIVEPLAARLEKARLFEDDQVSEYHTFSEPFEEALYRQLKQPERELRSAPYPYSRVLGLYGYLLVEFRRFEEARAVLARALRWNPVSFDLICEHIETFRMTGDLDRFFQLTVQTFPVAFRPRHVARLFRNLGYCFTEQKKYQEAASCYVMSMTFEKDSPQAVTEILYITRLNGGFPGAPSPDAVTAWSKQYGFPFGADPAVLNLAWVCGMHWYREKDMEEAAYWLSIFSDIAPRSMPEKAQADSILQAIRRAEP